MSSPNVLYPSSVAIPVTAPTVADSGEISLRDEFDSIINGTGGETPKGRTFILRRMRRDDDGELIKCICVDDTYNSPRRDYGNCPYCLNTGYLWDEETFNGYKVTIVSPSGSTADANLAKTETGSMYIPAARFYIPYDLSPTRSDRIIEIEYDEEGDPILPYNRIGTYEVILLRDLRADYGRIEYWVCHTQLVYQGTHGNVG